MLLFFAHILCVSHVVDVFLFVCLYYWTIGLCSLFKLRRGIFKINYFYPSYILLLLLQRWLNITFYYAEVVVVAVIFVHRGRLLMLLLLALLMLLWWYWWLLL